ncbi:MAG: RIP metalloprotease RseP [Bacteroidaceae bacterium]|nr:RIP metalloprotease RseP [Bacteroidaceae bacterium]MBQ7967900.1 RIP metalloprotease RseP [Bacteroidaceae bacterium]MBR4042293.1 RIP metalloprotease RseP [Bacteroidaceae bacterium]
MSIFLIKLIQVILSLTILVVVHEMGHFIFARIFGVRVERFSLFFGKPLLRYKPKRSETEYVVGWLPFGGYVELSGMIDESLNVEQMKQPPQPWEFRTKPAWQRLLIMIGGVCFNLIFACLLYAMILFKWGDSYVPLDSSKYGMEFNERAEAMGFRDGDVLVRTDKVALDRFGGDMLRAIVDAETVTVLREGSEVLITMPEEVSLLDFNGDVQPFVQFYNPMTIDSVIPGSAAALAGLMAGDDILSVNGTSTSTWITFNTALNQMREQEAEGEIVNHDLSVVYSRGGALDTVVVAADADFILGITVAMPYEPATKEYGFFASIPAGIAYGWNTLKGYVSDFKYVFTKEGATSLGGFGTIGSLFPSQWNWYSFWMMTAFISIILAFMNILPIPALDGGHLMFLLFEMITGRKPSDKFMERVQIIGMVLLFGLMIYANLNDIIRYFF